MPVTIGGQLVDGFGAKVLCFRQPESDTAVTSRALHISLAPSRKTLQVLDDAAVERIADDFQSRLLMFRLLHHREFVLPTMDLSRFGPRIRDLVRALMTPLGDSNNEVYRQLWQALINQECNARVDRAHEPEALVTIALFSWCHANGAETNLVGQIAALVNGNRKRLGEEADLKPRTPSPGEASSAATKLPAAGALHRRCITRG
ncbi:MAG: hypothetical protein WA188_08695 [Terriglobales bacterium]